MFKKTDSIINDPDDSLWDKVPEGQWRPQKDRPKQNGEITIIPLIPPKQREEKRPELEIPLPEDKPPTIDDYYREQKERYSF